MTWFVPFLGVEMQGEIVALVWFGVREKVTGLAGSRSREGFGKGGRDEPKATPGAFGFCAPETLRRLMHFAFLGLGVPLQPASPLRESPVLSFQVCVASAPVVTSAVALTRRSRLMASR